MFEQGGFGFVEGPAEIGPVAVMTMYLELAVLYGHISAYCGTRSSTARPDGNRRLDDRAGDFVAA